MILTDKTISIQKFGQFFIRINFRLQLLNTAFFRHGKIHKRMKKLHRQRRRRGAFVVYLLNRYAT